MKVKEGLRKKLFPNTSSENCTFTVCFETGKWLISQLLLFSHFKRDGESTIVNRRVGKNNEFHSWGKPIIFHRFIIKIIV